MVWMIENDITDVLDLTFSYEYDDFGELRVKDLKPDGRNIPVTQSNKL
jgi:E3 ubiquitin-protein ligase HUWE1